MTMNFRNVFQLLIDFFRKEEIDYALIGAFALKAYGYSRATQDIDFLARGQDQDTIIGMLESLGFETTYRSTGYSNHQHALSGLGRIDFVFARGGTADTLFRDVQELLVLGDIRIPVVSPEHLVALKVFAIKNNPQRSLREMADIEYLLKMPGVDREEMKKSFEKYGQMEKYHEIIRKAQK
jgi:hypothetical protein